MTDQNTVDRLKAAGIDVETVGNILGDVQFEAPAEPFEPPMLEGGVPFPAPGIYFGMPEAIYHAIHACSTSGLKNLSVSSMDYWANSLLNPDKAAFERKEYFDFGHAIHTLVLEGEEAYAARYVIELDKAMFGDKLLETTDQIKAAIIALDQKPISKGFDDVTRSAKKDDWIEQLLALDPEALVWDRIVSAFGKDHAGAEFISASVDKRVRIATKMILAHPEIAAALTGGHAEVSVFWYCPVTGCPMKARFDYLKMRLIADLKSFGNKGGMPIDRAIERTIAAMRYNLQHVIYVEAAMVARKMIREAAESQSALLPPIFFYGDWSHEDMEIVGSWCRKWADQTADPAFLFVFQQAGIAPVTRGKWMPQGTVWSVTKSRATALKRKWIECAQTYGTDPWLDIEPIDTIEDEAIPLYATEI